MKKVIKVIFILLFLVFLGIQFIRPNRINPSINKNETLENVVSVPADVQKIFNRSCNDCHSNNTNYPWYSNIAPISWSVVDHIKDGREELNFSKWGTYSDQRKERKLEEICEEIRERHMPHNQYLWIHWDAQLTDSDIKIICDWSKKEIIQLAKTN
jgi:hypothetical protein